MKCGNLNLVESCDNMKERNSYNQKGFTLVELAVVIAVIGILAALIVPSLLGYVKKANRKSDIETARLIGQCVMQVMLEDPDAEASFYNMHSSSSKKTVTQDGETYDIWLVVRLDGNVNNKSGNSLGGSKWQGVQRETEPFAEAMNKQRNMIIGSDRRNTRNRSDGQMLIAPMRSSEFRGKNTDRWFVAYRLDKKGKPTDTIEVWAGDSSGKYGSGMSYRLWPSPPAGY